MLRNVFLPIYLSDQKNQEPDSQYHLTELDFDPSKDYREVLIGICHHIGNKTDSTLNMIITSMVCNNEFSVRLPPQIFELILSFLNIEITRILREFIYYAKTIYEIIEEVNPVMTNFYVNDYFDYHKNNYFEICNHELLSYNCAPVYHFPEDLHLRFVEYHKSFNRFNKQFNPLKRVYGLLFDKNFNYYAKGVYIRAKAYVRAFETININPNIFNQTETLILQKYYEIQDFKSQRRTDLLPFSNEIEDMEFIILINTLKNLLVKYMEDNNVYNRQSIINDSLTLKYYTDMTEFNLNLI